LPDAGCGYGDRVSDVAYIGPGGRRRRSRPLLRTVVGDALRRHRLDQGRTLADVARAARVSMPYLSEVERGRKEASSEVLAAVCDALRLDLSDLLVDVGREMVQDRSPLIRLDPAQRRSRPGTSGGQPTASVRRSGDVVLLAA
jgi:transcriptional regulator with XRE-family HTH domain